MELLIQALIGIVAILAMGAILSVTGCIWINIGGAVLLAIVLIIAWYLEDNDIINF